jgi:hypothetical protein
MVIFNEEIDFEKTTNCTNIKCLKTLEGYLLKVGESGKGVLFVNNRHRFVNNNCLLMLLITYVLGTL